MALSTPASVEVDETVTAEIRDLYQLPDLADSNLSEWAASVHFPAQAQPTRVHVFTVKGTRPEPALFLRKLLIAATSRFAATGKILRHV